VSTPRREEEESQLVSMDSTNYSTFGRGEPAFCNSWRAFLCDLAIVLATADVLTVLCNSPKSPCNMFGIWHFWSIGYGLILFWLMELIKILDVIFDRWHIFPIQIYLNYQ
jgi:hypothetical protein